MEFGTVNALYLVPPSSLERGGAASWSPRSRLPENFPKSPQNCLGRLSGSFDPLGYAARSKTRTRGLTPLYLRAIRNTAKLPGDRRKRRLLGPIIAMTLSGMLLLFGLALFLVYRFDQAASLRERNMVEHGFERQLQEFDAIIVPQADWDDAVLKLEHSFDPNWADRNFGTYLYTFNGFTRVFFVDGQDRPVYAASDGVRAGLDRYAPFAEELTAMIAKVRRAEALRPPLRARPGAKDMITPPIQVNALVQAEGKVFIAIATLVQPDVGLVMPRGKQAPIAITALPLDRAMLDAFAARYLVENLELVDGPPTASGKNWVALHGPDGVQVATLAWTPRRPGTALLRALMVSLLSALGLLGAIGWSIVRRSDVIVTELIASEARARHLAYHDPLTRLPNRALLFERLEVLLRGAGDPPLAVLCVDLDRFKEVNDTMGHGAGDALIEVVAERLRATCDAGCVIARQGGDEFVVLAPATARSAAEALAERILRAVSPVFDSEFGRIEVGCSIGAALIDRSGIEPSQALRWADLALYRAKDQGRGCVCFFEPEMDAALTMRRTLEADLRAALSDDSLHMVYQPQVGRNGDVIAVEALLRWTHPQRGAISPELFVPLAEECGLIRPLGEWVLRRVLQETSHWRHLRVAINISAVQMRTPGFAALLMQLAARAGVDPARYEIELTETALLGDDPVTRGNFDVLKRFGFTIALDDFGTGYSSLSLLQRFAVDKIKIDRSFVASLGESEGADGLVDAVVKLARSFGLEVIGEGVEIERQRQQLLACGCQVFQGYLIGRPVAAGQIELDLPGGAEPRRAVNSRG